MTYIPEIIKSTSTEGDKYFHIFNHFEVESFERIFQKINIDSIRNPSNSNIEINYSVVKVGNTYYADPVNDTSTSFYHLPSAIAVFRSLLSATNNVELFLADGEKLVIPIACMKTHQYDTLLSTNRRLWVTYTLTRNDQNDKIVLNEQITGNNLTKGHYSYFQYLHNYICRNKQNIHVLSLDNYKVRHSLNDLGYVASFLKSKGTTLDFIGKFLNGAISNNQPISTSKGEKHELTALEYISMVINSFLSQLRVFRKREFKSFVSSLFIFNFLLLFSIFCYIPSLTPLSLISLMPTGISHSFILSRVVLSSIMSLLNTLIYSLVPLPHFVNNFSDWPVLNDELTPKSFNTHQSLYEEITKKENKSPLRPQVADFFAEQLSRHRLLKPSAVASLFICPISDQLISTPVVYNADKNIKNIKKSTIYDKSYLNVAMTQCNIEPNDAVRNDQFVTNLFNIFKKHYNLESYDGIGSDAQNTVKSYLERESLNETCDTDFSHLDKSDTDMIPNSFKSLFHPSTYDCYPTMGL